MIDAFDRELLNIFRNDERVVIIGADDGRFHNKGITSNGYSRYLNVGISECDALGVAAGLACCGKKVVVTAGGSFLAHRANEFIRNDVCMQNLDVKIIAIGAGLALNALGNTQHMTEDISGLRAFPNLQIVTPASPKEAAYVANKMMEINNPMYIRLGRHEGIDIYDEYSLNYKPRKAQTVIEGKDLIIISTGTIITDIISVVEELNQDGVYPEVINMHTIKPIDSLAVINAISKTKKLLIVEEHSIYGGLRSAISEIIAESGISIKLDYIGLNDCFAQGFGSYREIKNNNGLSQEIIKQKALKLLTT